MAARNITAVILTVGLFMGVIRTGTSTGPLPQPDKKEVAVQWFKEGQFEKALPVFSRLSYDFPYDFLMKYYYGACLVETGQLIPDAKKNLILASSAEVPVRVFYYLARFFHGTEDWNNAQRYYNRFKNNAGASEVKDLDIDGLIQLCYKEINLFSSEKNEKPVSSDSQAVHINTDTLKMVGNLTVENPVVPDSTVISAGGHDTISIQVTGDEIAIADTLHSGKEDPDSVQTGYILENMTSVGDSLVADSGEIQKIPDFINFQINDKITYLIEGMFHVAEAKAEFRKALDKELQLDSMLKVVQQLRRQYHLNANPMVRDSLASGIQNLEYQNLVLNTEVDQHYFQARKLEQGWWSKADFSEFNKYSEEKDSLIRMKEQLNKPVIVEEILPVYPSDTLVSVIENDSLTVKKEIRDENELIYKIQIGAFDKGITKQRKLLFERLEKIRTIEKLPQESGIIIYATGNVRNFNDAIKLQNQIRQEGIKDAFVIATRNGIRVPLPKDVQIENE